MITSSIITCILRSCAAARNALKVVQRPVAGIHIQIVRDIVAVVAQRRGKERQQPQARDAQILQIIQLLHQPGKVADAVVVAVHECADVQFVDDRVLEPQADPPCCPLASNRSPRVAGAFVIVHLRNRARDYPAQSPGRRAPALHTDAARHNSAIPASDSRDLPTDRRPQRSPHPQPKRSQIERHKSSLRVHRVETHDRQHYVCSIVGRLAIRNDLRVVRRMETRFSLRCSAGLARRASIQPRDQRSQRVRRITVPALDLVLLAVQILLAALLEAACSRPARTPARTCRSSRRASQPAPAGS